MKKLALVYFIFFGMLTSVFGQTRNIVGRILSNEEQKPIKNANIVVEGSEISTVSNHLGFFALELNDEDVGPLIISHIGYTTSKVEVPEIDNFKILLSKEYIHIAEFDLAYFEERELALAEGSTDSLGAKEVSAKYPGGWEHFFNDLGSVLIKTSFWKGLYESGDSVLLLSFTVDQSGLITEIAYDPQLENSDSITIQINTLKNWVPAKQNGNPTSQFFKLSLKWTEVFSTEISPPLPEGGMPAFEKFLEDNLKYPMRSRSLGVEGRVFVEFIVEKDGGLTEIKILKGVSSDLDKEAMRVISFSKWEPGSRKGERIRQRVVVPITFKLR
ncbi:MAG: TonB family protein [Cyclobacteriaceae bacterium]